MLESANQKTLDALNKGQTVEQIYRACQWASEAGLHVNGTIMLGHPNETIEDTERTVEMVRTLFRHGWLRTVQFTLLMAYPGTQLFKDAERNGWLRYAHDWPSYDMRTPALTSPVSDDQLLGLVRRGYQTALSPQYAWHYFRTLRTWDEIAFLWRGLKLFLGHLTDFAGVHA